MTSDAEQQKQLLREKLRDAIDGNVVTIKFVHHRDIDTVRQVRGAIFKNAFEDSWMIKVSDTSTVKIPSDDVTIIFVESSNRQPSMSAQRIDPGSDVHSLATISFGDQLAQDSSDRDRPATDTQRHPAQPAPVDELNDPVYLRKLLVAFTTRAAQEVPPPPPSAYRATPGSDLQTFMSIGDALRGQDNPTWRLCSGTVMHRTVQPMFLVVSIPHLIFEDDDSTNGMVKRRKGKAMELYHSLSWVKMQSPNQAVSKFNTRNGNGKNTAQGQQPVLSSEAALGVRAELERSERMFVTLLGQLDSLEQHELPPSKNEWMLFLDAGIAVLSCYATLANGFVQGGAKISTSYAKAISKGKFDPAALWAETETEFRKSK